MPAQSNAKALGSGAGMTCMAKSSKKVVPAGPPSDCETNWNEVNANPLGTVVVVPSTVKLTDSACELMVS